MAYPYDIKFPNGRGINLNSPRRENRTRFTYNVTANYLSENRNKKVLIAAIDVYETKRELQRLYPHLIASIDGKFVDVSFPACEK